MGRDGRRRGQWRTEACHRARAECGIRVRLHLPTAEARWGIAGILDEHLDGDELEARDGARGGGRGAGIVGDAEDGDALRLNHARVAGGERHAEVDIGVGRRRQGWRGRRWRYRGGGRRRGGRGRRCCWLRGRCGAEVGERDARRGRRRCPVRRSPRRSRSPRRGRPRRQERSRRRCTATASAAAVPRQAGRTAGAADCWGLCHTLSLPRDDPPVFASYCRSGRHDERHVVQFSPRGHERRPSDRPVPAIADCITMIPDSVYPYAVTACSSGTSRYVSPFSSP